MTILIKQNFLAITKKKQTNKTRKQIRIIIPKKYIKKAVIRNKIRRQIRVILLNNNIKSCLVKYCYNEKMSFDNLKAEITNKIK